MKTGAGQKRRLLILGGTTEARELAALAGAHLGARLEIITSLAGRTEDFARPMGTVRRGGFGGAAGLAAYLRAEAIDYLIDATHPFARRISGHAVTAAASAGVPHLMLLRPAWRRADDDRWIDVADAHAAAALLPGLERRVWLTVGSADLAAFAAVPDTWFLVRRIAPPAAPLPLRDVELILGRGPFSLADERRLIAEYRIDSLVCRASGGAATEAKLTAAREARLPVIMIRRPPEVAAASVDTAAAALAWLVRRMDA